jgi:hypothetical protein
MTANRHRPRTTLAHRCLLLLALCVPVAGSLAGTPDPHLLIAIDSIWQLERPAVSTLAERFEAREGVQPARFESGVRDTVSYQLQDAEGAQIEFARKRFPATESRWGALPRLDVDSARLLEITLPRKRYQVISATGEGLFRIGDWQRFGVLHVVDISQRWAPLHYPLIAEAGLRERVLGRLPGSPTLNYLRLVPAHWATADDITAYEVLVYALNPRGPERVNGADGKPLAWRLDRNAQTRQWSLATTDATPIADARDQAGLAFTAPPRIDERAYGLPVAIAASDEEAAEAIGEATDGIAAAATAATTADSKDGATATAASRSSNTQARSTARRVGDAAADAAVDAAEDRAKDAAASSVKRSLPGQR